MGNGDTHDRLRSEHRSKGRPTNIQAQKTRFIRKVLADNAILVALQRNKTYLSGNVDSGPFRLAFADRLMSFSSCRKTVNRLYSLILGYFDMVKSILNGTSRIEFAE